MTPATSTTGTAGRGAPTWSRKSSRWPSTHSFDDTREGGFDDEADFEDHDLLGTPNPFTQSDFPIWLDVGESDPFRPTVTALANQLIAQDEDVAFQVLPGGHDDSYWAANIAAYLDFYATALTGCGPAGV